MSREVIANGNELAAKAAIDCGCRFFGGYPITPSSEIAHKLSILLPKEGGKFIQMEDEIGGISVALGASMSGVKSMTATSGPGMSLKSEQIGLSFIAEIPIVIVNVMRGGPSTGLPTRVSQGDVIQAKHPTHGDYASITIAPGSLEEAYSEVVRAFNLSEKYMTPVIVLLDETLGHMFGKALLPDLEDVEQSIIKRKEFLGDKNQYRPYAVKKAQPAVLNPFFKGYRYHITGLHHDDIGFPTENETICQNNMVRLMEKIQSNKDDILKYEEYMIDDADFLIIAYGSVSRAAEEAISFLRKDGIKVGLFRPITIWPSPEKELKKIASKFDSDKIVVAELNMGQFSDEVERIIRKDFKTIFKANGRPISPIEIVKKIKEGV